jgi:hypothetical protein
MSDDLETPPEGTPAGGTPPVVPPAPPVARVTGHGGEIPEERIADIKARERRKFLREHYGTDNEDEALRIKGEREAAAKKAKDFEEAEQKRKLAELSEVDRLKEELRLEREGRAAEKTTLESQLAQRQTALEVERQEVLIGGVASKYVAPKFTKLAKVEFGEYVETLTKTQLKDFDQAAIDKWFKKWATDNAEYKLGFTPTAPVVPPPKAPPPPTRVPVGGKAPVRPAPRPPAPPTSTGAGTFKGKPIKSLNREELAEYRASLGKPARAY